MEESAGDELMLLLRNLSPSERRYCTLQFRGGTEGRRSPQELLYQHLLETDAWDEVAIRNRFAGAQFLQQLNVVRTRLLEALLDMLALHDQGKSFQLDLSRRLNHIDLLFRRRLIASCLRTTRVMQRRVQRLQMPLVEMQVVGYLLRMERQATGVDLLARLQPLNDRQAQLAVAVAQEAALAQLHDQLFACLPQNRTADHAVVPAEAHAQLRAIAPTPDGLHFDARVLYHHIEGYIARLLGDRDGQYEALERLTRVWEAFPDRIRLDEGRYATTLFSLGELAVTVRKDDAFASVVSKLKRLLQRSTTLRPVEQAKLLNLQLRYSAEAGHWAEGLLLLHEVQATLERFQSTIPPLIRLSLRSNAVLVAVVMEEWTLALAWADLLARDPWQHDSATFVELIRVTEWMAWYSLRQYDPLEKALIRQQKSRKPQQASGIVQAFSALLSGTDASTPTHSLMQLQTWLGEQPSTPANWLLKVWSLARLKGIPMAAATKLF